MFIKFYILIQFSGIFIQWYRKLVKLFKTIQISYNLSTNIGSVKGTRWSDWNPFANWHLTLTSLLTLPRANIDTVLAILRDIEKNFDYKSFQRELFCKCIKASYFCSLVDTVLVFFQDCSIWSLIIVWGDSNPITFEGSKFVPHSWLHITSTSSYSCFLPLFSQTLRQYWRPQKFGEWSRTRLAILCYLKYKKVDVNNTIFL